MRLRPLVPCLLALAGCLAAGGAALAQSPAEGDGGGPTAPYLYPTVSSSDWGPFTAKGMPITCGEPAKGSAPAVHCRVTARITVKPALVHYLGLGSTVLAHGVAGNETSGRDGYTYFLKLPGSALTKLMAKRVKGLGMHVTGSAGLPDGSQFFCDNRPGLVTACPVSSEKLTTVSKQGAMLCWVYMPWQLAIPAKWGAKCPRPKQI